MSSSPGLPSPSQLFAAMPSQLVGGSRAAPIPKDAVAGFASASTLLRLARFGKEVARGSEISETSRNEKKSISQAQVESTTTEKGKEPVFKVFRIPAVGASNTRDGQSHSAELERPNQDGIISKASAPRKPRQKKVEDGQGQTKKIDRGLQSDMNTTTTSNRPSDDAKATEASAPKKSRKKKTKDENEGQTKIKKAKIVKPGSSKVMEKSKKSKLPTAETFNTLLGTQEEDAKAREEFRDLCSEKAIPMRRGWTPCKDTVEDRVSQANDTKSGESISLEVTPVVNEVSSNCFGQLLGNFGFAQDISIPVMRPEVTRRESAEAEPGSRKRKIEFINGVSALPLAEKQTRTKSPKKKPQTITEKATAPFVPTDPLTAPSLLQCFSPSEAPPDVETVRNETSANAKMKPPAKKAPKPKTTNPLAKKLKRPVLLSPESAMKNAKDQELVFGTSSQLAREESPTTIKDLQNAMEESAIMSQESDNLIMPAGKFRTSNSLALVRPRNLWTVATRDTDGSLLEAETVDLTATPKPARSKSELAPCLVTASEGIAQNLPNCQQRSGSNHDIDPANLDLETTPKPQNIPQESIPKTVAEAALRKRPSNRCPVKNATNSKSDPNQMPNYQGFTDAQLAKAVAAYGFKSIKKRAAMITLLEKCWESKVSLAFLEVQANLHPPPPVTNPADPEVSTKSTSPKKRGRPPKTTTAANLVADQPPPKKPRGRPKKDPTVTTPPPKSKRKAKSPVKALSEALVTAEDDIYDSSPPTATPPRRSSKSPHQLPLKEKTNTPVKASVVKGREARDQLFAQMTKAITTFPPTNDIKNMTFHEKILMYEPIVLEDLTTWLNTQGLASVGEDDEVEPLLVKEWCEERSVCCLWRENLRGGARARY